VRKVTHASAAVPLIFLNALHSGTERSTLGSVAAHYKLFSSGIT
jgi:hypothetical protein